MKTKYIQTLGIVLTTFYALFIIWLYAQKPRTIAEIAVKAEVSAGIYEIDRAKFNEGLRLFRADKFAEARAVFEQADSERRDANVQFYKAYSFYRQGFGRFSNDDALYKQGIEAVNQVIKIEPNFRTADADLQLKTASELKTELEQGINFTVEDLNPLRALRERK